MMFLLAGILLKGTGADSLVVQAIGRNADLTGRTDIWALVIPMAPNALVGAGFESFWLGPRLLKAWAAFPYLRLNEAHNGYLEVYLNLGLVGVGLVALILIAGYRRAVAAFRIDSTSASLMLALVVCSVIYSYTEAGFRMLDLTWCFPLLAMFAATRISGLRRIARPDSTHSGASARVRQTCLTLPETGP
jgi:O-antigen ligase